MLLVVKSQTPYLYSVDWRMLLIEMDLKVQDGGA
jgi:hypothetical protein